MREQHSAGNLYFSQLGFYSSDELIGLFVSLLLVAFLLLLAFQPAVFNVPCVPFVVGSVLLLMSQLLLAISHCLRPTCWLASLLLLISLMCWCPYCCWLPPVGSISDVAGAPTVLTGAPSGVPILNIGS